MKYNLEGMVLSWFVRFAFLINLFESIYHKSTFLTHVKMVLVIVALYSHNITGFTPPGIIKYKMFKKKTSDLESQHKYWNKYVSSRHGNILYPPSAHWCSNYNAMVMRMDHYCPWTNNTIGLFNFKPFFLFTIYTFLACACTLINSIYRERLCYVDITYCIRSKQLFYLSITNLVIATFGFIFTFVMIFECIKSIYYNAAYIDRLKKIQHESTRFLATFNLLMGRWFFVPIVYHDTVEHYFDMEINKTIEMLKKYDIYVESY
jgi:hypothetical protein